ncbi:YceI family protein [Aurantibacillus circumpalustris]|uniref:YceI family protein n=1 Tax=Aurantibacillus circumpalustris TaxID=3036359 RepID=UPI00295B8032|nr:YceI family protein [Aurantibacillus circumpalustris]
MSKIKWNLDLSHSEVTFKVKHMMITNVSGSFTDFVVNAETDGEDFTKSEINFSTKAASVNTGSEQRDGHLRTAEFFDAEKFPEIKFKATKYEKVSGDDYILYGDLTIKDTTKNILLNVEFGGIQKDPYGNIKAGFTVNGKINRKDFGLTWNAALETGGVMVSEEVKINCEIQLVKA